MREQQTTHCAQILWGSSVCSTTAIITKAGRYNSVKEWMQQYEQNRTTLPHWNNSNQLKAAKAVKAGQLATILTWRRSCSSWGLRSELPVATWRTSRPPGPRLRAIGLSSRSRCCGWWTRTWEPNAENTGNTVVSGRNSWICLTLLRWV